MLLGLVITTPALAVEYDIQGFVSKGVVISEGTPLFTKKPDSTSYITQTSLKLGLQANANLSFSTQIHYQKYGDYIDDELNIEHIMASHVLARKDNYTNGIKIGRLKPEIGLYNSTRDLPWTKPSIFMPKSIYPDLLRDSYLAYDGGELFP